MRHLAIAAGVAAIFLTGSAQAREAYIVKVPTIGCIDRAALVCGWHGVE